MIDPLEIRLLDEESASGAEDGATSCDEECQKKVKEEEEAAAIAAGEFEGSEGGEPVDEENKEAKSDEKKPTKTKTPMELADDDAIYPKDWPFTRDELRSGAFIIYIIGKLKSLNSNPSALFRNHVLVFGHFPRNSALHQSIN